MAYKSKYTGAEIEAKLDLVYNKYFNPVVPDEPVEPEPLPLGVFIQHVNGSLYTTDEWTAKGFASADANGVAVSAEECAFVIAKEKATDTKMGWSSNTNTLVEGIITTSVAAEAKLDYYGRANTDILIADSTSAAYVANNYTFPNGQKGYLGAIGEWWLAYQNKEAADACMSLIGGERIYNDFNYWSSTQYDISKAWGFGWNQGVLKQSKGSVLLVRPFTTL